MGLKEIAALTGLSANTVSRALRGCGYVSTAAREKILAAAQATGYRPNRAARSLRSGGSGEIAVVAPVESGAAHGDALFFDKLIGMKEFLLETAYELVPYFLIRGEADRNARTLRHLADTRPAGVILLDGALPVPELAAFPLVRVTGEAFPAGDSVAVDRAGGVTAAVRELIRRGRRRIALAMADGAADYTSQSRYRGYRQAMAELNLPEMVLVALDYARGPYESGRRLAARLDGCDAVIAYSDYLAAGLLAGLRERDIRVPDELAVVGFDDRELAAFTTPRLTTLAQPNREIGQLAAELLLHRLAAPEAEAEYRQLPMQLILRESI